MTSRKVCLAVLLFTFSAAVASAQSGKGTGEVSGQVLNSNGSPAAGLDVAIIAATNTFMMNGNRLVVEPKAVVARTDGAGRYRVAIVSSGSYYVAAGVIRKCPPAAACPVGQWIEQATFFPGVADLAAARPVTVSAGNVIADFQLAGAQARPTGFAGKWATDEAIAWNAAKRAGSAGAAGLPATTGPRGAVAGQANMLEIKLDGKKVTGSFTQIGIVMCQVRDPEKTVYTLENATVKGETITFQVSSQPCRNAPARGVISGTIGNAPSGLADAIGGNAAPTWAGVLSADGQTITLRLQTAARAGLLQGFVLRRIPD